MDILFLTIYFIILLVIFLIFVGWLDWKFKCRKTIKENNLNTYLNGYAIFKSDDSEPNLLLYNGILGINAKQMVFTHRRKNDVRNFKKSIQDIKAIEILEYNENNYKKLLHKSYSIDEEDIKYTVVKVSGIKDVNELPKIVKNRSLCKISFINDIDLCFIYKRSSKNTEILTKK